jgi:hypothetical protein
LRVRENNEYCICTLEDVAETYFQFLCDILFHSFGDLRIDPIVVLVSS